MKFPLGNLFILNASDIFAAIGKKSNCDKCLKSVVHSHKCNKNFGCNKKEWIRQVNGEWSIKSELAIQTVPEMCFKKSVLYINFCFISVLHFIPFFSGI